jgi:hypothetical protein
MTLDKRVTRRHVPCSPIIRETSSAFPPLYQDSPSHCKRRVQPPSRQYGLSRRPWYRLQGGSTLSDIPAKLRNRHDQSLDSIVLEDDYSRDMVSYHSQDFSICFLSSLSFCETSSSSLSMLYSRASLLCLTALALNFASPPSFWTAPLALFPLRPYADGWFRLLPGLSVRRPCWSSARAFRDSMRRSTRSICESARSSRVVIAGPISSRSEASAAARVGWGMSS